MFNNNFNQTQSYTPPYINTFQNGYTSSQQVNNITSPQFVVRNVNNYEEAKNLSIDFYNTFLLLDFNNSSIYFKKINNNGLEEFYTFKQTANPLDRFQSIEQRLAVIENFITSGVKQNEPIESNESNNVSNASNTNTATKPRAVSKVSANDTK